MIAHGAQFGRRYVQTVVRGPTADRRYPRCAPRARWHGAASSHTGRLGHHRGRPAQHPRQTPAAFVENRGQLDGEVRYYAQGRRYAFYLTPAVLSFVPRFVRSSRRHPRAGIPGQHRPKRPEGLDRASGAINYFRGSDSAAWLTGLARYAQVAYPNLWPGIDLRLAVADLSPPHAAFRLKAEATDS